MFQVHNHTPKQFKVCIVYNKEKKHCFKQLMVAAHSVNHCKDDRKLHINKAEMFEGRNDTILNRNHNAWFQVFGIL